MKKPELGSRDAELQAILVRGVKCLLLHCADSKVRISCQGSRERQALVVETAVDCGLGLQESPAIWVVRIYIHNTLTSFHVCFNVFCVFTV